MSTTPPLGRAGFRAAQQVAHSEAIGYFSKALELLPRLPNDAARDRLELDLQLALSWSLLVARGAGAPERESALMRARELCEQLEENAKLMETLLALAGARVSVDLEVARELAERVLAMAQQAEVSAMLAGAHHILGAVAFRSAQFLAARDHLERAVVLFAAGPSRRGNYGAYFAQLAPNLLVGTLIILGYPSTALTRAHELLAAARRSADPHSIAIALFKDGMNHLLLRDTRMMLEQGGEMLAIATEHGMGFI